MELAETAFASTKSKSAEILESSTAAAQRIQDAIAALSALLSARAAQTLANPAPTASAAAPPKSAVSSEAAREAATSGEDPSTDVTDVRRLPELSTKALGELDRVRKLMVPRARFLSCLKSHVPGGEVVLSLDEAPGITITEVRAATPQSGKSSGKATSEGKDKGKASPEPAKKGVRKDSGKTSPAGGKKRVSVERETSEPEEIDTSTLTGQIKKLLADCRSKLCDACRAYFAKLQESGREPTRGARILEDEAAMAELHERTLAQIEWEGEEHREAAVTRLRAQVRREWSGLREVSACGDRLETEKRMLGRNTRSDSNFSLLETNSDPDVGRAAGIPEFSDRYVVQHFATLAKVKIVGAALILLRHRRARESVSRKR